MSSTYSPIVVFTRWWTRRPSREKLLLMLATALVSSGLLWNMGIAPALRNIKAYPSQQETLKAQLQHMQVLQAQALSLKGQMPFDAVAAETEFRTSVASLGLNANIMSVGSQVSVTLKGVDAVVLAKWLARVRSEARLVPSQAELSRDGNVWSGTVQFNMPTN